MQFAKMVEILYKGEPGLLNQPEKLNAQASSLKPAIYSSIDPVISGLDYNRFCIHHNLSVLMAEYLYDDILGVDRHSQ
jgi:hypothetical protein